MNVLLFSCPTFRKKNDLFEFNISCPGVILIYEAGGSIFYYYLQYMPN